jgi:predicted 3-demethylubiquinone-9 3-methyltransferase (glyoxalase superfamily)
MNAQKITPFLWFDNQAEEAVNFYISIFANSKILQIARYGDAGPGPAGSVMTLSFQLEGQKFVALNGGPVFHFTPAISFVVDCKTQEEVDRLWDALTADGGKPGQCAWLTDRYGISWQIFPNRLVELLTDPDPEKANRVMQAMMQMTKIDIAALEAVYAGKTVE